MVVHSGNAHFRMFSVVAEKKKKKRKEKRERERTETHPTKLLAVVLRIADSGTCCGGRRKKQMK